MTSVRSRSSNRNWQNWIDLLAILAWGILLLKYWLTGKLNILLHPYYFWMAYSAGFFLLGLGIFKAIEILQQLRRRSRVILPPVQHLSLFPPGWSSALLLAVAIFGLQFTPQPFASEVALNRGVTDTLTMTRSQPQAFRGNVRSEDRSIVEWVRTLNVYPEPDAYQGQKANVEGFVIHRPEQGDRYFMISRFVITCCAADVYPVGLPVKLPEGQALPKSDAWLRVEGEMMTETLEGQRQLVIQAKTISEIPKPENPYDY